MKQKDAVSVLAALDAIGAAMPDDFRWPMSLRLAYERAARLLVKYS